jgi:hypothetical protein
MTRLADQNVRCPACAETLSIWVTISRNNFSAFYYTDGYVSGVSRDAEYVVCDACGAGLWWREHAFGEANYEGVPLGEDAPRPGARRPVDEEYPDFIRNAVWRNANEERYIRMCAWWAWNNPYRPTYESIRRRRLCNQDPFPTATWPDEAYENCRRLHQCLLRTDDAIIVLRAELYRECKEFDACIALLNRSFKGRHEHDARFIEGLARDGKHTITMIPLREEDRLRPGAGGFCCERWAEEPITNDP